jgi:Zn-dependent M28 family amino/carboxypeptidase
MLRAKVVSLVFALPAIAVNARAADFSGASAMKFAREAVAFGPRPSGSEAIRKLQAYIVAQLKTCGCQVTEDAFTAKTPKGDIAMKNIIAKYPGKSGKAVVVTGHYDTKLFPGRKFVGGNDGGSSTGLLLELARVLPRQPRIDDVYLVFFDGEEAVREQWEGEDNLYGSRHLAAKWKADGTLGRVKALINIDMIGDKSLDIKPEGNSNQGLRRLVWNAAKELGYQAYFLEEGVGPIEDDHIPFQRLGVPVLDIIDFDYPPWHTDEDTIDKLSSQSLETVGTVVAEAIRRLERQ